MTKRPPMETTVPSAGAFSGDNLWRKLSYALILLVGLIMLFTFLDYGVTTDEEPQRMYGDSVLSWYTSFFQDRAAVDGDSYQVLFGGFFEVLGQLAARVLPWGLYESRHLVNGLFGLLAIAAAYKIASCVVNPMAGFFSAFFLTLTPAFYGHSFNNSKDIPFATMYAISLYFILTSYGKLPRLSKSSLIKTGASIGLTAAVRVGGLVLFGYMAAFWFGWLLSQWGAKALDKADERRKKIVSLALSYVLIAVIGWVAMLAWWPWGQLNPLVNPFKALAMFGRYDLALGVHSLFKGRYIPAEDLPRSYLPTWFSISLPEFYFIALAAGCIFTGRFILRFKKDAVHYERLSKMTLLCIGALFPVITAILLRPPLYETMRHFLFVIPPLAVLAGVSFAGLLRSRIDWRVKAAASVLMTIASGMVVVDMIQLHPYQYVFYNRAVAGGLKRASLEFDTEYWGASNREGIEWLVKNYHPPGEEPIGLMTCDGLPFQIDYFLNRSDETRQRFRAVGTEEEAHILLASLRRRCRETPGKVLHVVERQGAPLLYVIELRSPR